MTAAAPTVPALLAEELSPSRRAQHLEELCARFTGQPLDTTVASLRAALAVGIGMEDFRRLHVLISHLYHACGASIPLTTVLRTEVNAAVARRQDPVELEVLGR
ncbi:hypothetical protein [Actinacidiphila rubida]|uniref:Uncharacterized protein n=1 Tax=Actinacidiphila rubida TaxID=310780 RepID=A0A1H8T013_9ACTN|nr:hypothetical protein [Actinacidiphila rubida]SEO84135.1 hypothetical protein SAMN05216267_104688 [Actinacidiphila rubida]